MYREANSAHNSTLVVVQKQIMTHRSDVRQGIKTNPSQSLLTLMNIQSVH